MLWVVAIVLGLVAAFLAGWALRGTRWETFRFERRMRRILKERFPGARVRFRPGWVELRGDHAGVEAPTGPLRVRLDADPDRSEPHVAHFLAELDRALRQQRTKGLSKAEAGDRIVPVLLPLDRAEQLGGARRHVCHLGGGLDVAFAWDSPSSGIWLTSEDLARWDEVEPDLYRRSVENLWKRTNGAVIVHERVGPGVDLYRIEQGDGLDASRLLLEPLWDRVREQCGGELVLGVPSRDRVYAAPASQPRSVERLAERLSDDFLRRPHQVSPRMWVWNRGKLEPWSMNA